MNGDPDRCRTLLLATGLGTVVLARALWIATQDFQALITFIPDDTFYYFQVARGRFEFGRWTFDDGVSVTNGFHILYAYLSLAGIAAAEFLHATPEAFTRAAVIFHGILGGLLAGGLFSLASRLWGWAGGLAAALVALSLPFLLSSVFPIEWPLCVGAGLALFEIVHRHLNATSRQPILAPFAVGCIGVLARSDFALFATLCGFVLAVRAVILDLAEHGAGRMPQRLIRSADFVFVFSLAAGVVLGLAIVSLHNWTITGELLSDSALMKAYWSSKEGGSFRPAIGLLLGLGGVALLVHFIKLKWIAAAVFLLAAGLIGARVSARHRDFSSRINGKATMDGLVGMFRDEKGTTALMSFAILAGYVLTYRFVSGVQYWYSANLIIPSAIFFSAMIAFAAGSEPRARIWTTLVVAILAISNGAVSLSAPYPQMAYHYRTALMLARIVPEGARVGAWNAGTFGFFSNGRIVNLDGLVNADARRYIKASTLGNYMADANISYILDYQWMFNPIGRRTGGYTDPAFDKALSEVMTIPGTEGTFNGTAMKLYRFDGKAYKAATD